MMLKKADHVYFDLSTCGSNGEEGGARRMGGVCEESTFVSAMSTS